MTFSNVEIATQYRNNFKTSQFISEWVLNIQQFLSKWMLTRIFVSYVDELKPF